MRTPTPEYLHGTRAEEQERLGLLNQLLNRRMLDELDLRGGERVLELGAGTGIFARAMARQGARVVAVERSPDQLAACRQLTADEAARFTGSPSAPGDGHVEYRQGDALAPPLSEEEWGTFDVAHARFLLEHLPDPLACVRQMVRAVRPGGRIVLADDDHSLLRLWPEPEGVLDLWTAYADVYRRVGNDPLVGRRLVKLLVDAGAEPVRNTLVFFGGCSGEPHFQDVVENLAGVIESARDRLVTPGPQGSAGSDRSERRREGGGSIPAQHFDATLARFRAFGERSDASVWYGLPWAEARRGS